MGYIDVPNSNKRLYIGSIVVLDRLPDVKWIVKNGWYIYENVRYNGWYFCSIPADTILPVEESDLVNLTIVSTGEDTNPASCSSCIPYHLFNIQNPSSGCKSFAINFKESFGTDEPTKLDADKYLTKLKPPIVPHESISFINTDETSITYNALYMYFRLPDTNELVFKTNCTKTDHIQSDTIQGIL